MRILHVADFVSEKTGYQDFLLPKFQAHRGNEVHIVTSCWNPPAPNYEASLEPFLGPRRMSTGTSSSSGVWIHRLPVLWEAKNRVILKGLATACGSIRPDAIFVHDTMTPTALRMVGIARSMRVPLYFDNHSIFSVQNRSVISRSAYATFRLVMRTYVAPRTTRFFGVANECVDFLVQAQGVPVDKAELLPLGVDPDLFRPRAEEGREWRRRHGIDEESFVILQTGKLNAAKDPATLVEAVIRMRQQKQHVHLILVGAGEPQYVEALRTQVMTRSPHGISVLPPVEVTQLADVFCGSDVVVFPGGTSMSSLEAAACGRLVVMNDESVSQWRSALGVGRTFREGDPADLCRVLEELRDMSLEERSSLGLVARAATLRAFSYESIATELDRLMLVDSQSMAAAIQA